mmetsp:Transcript_78982/g.221409  ORF Transcript_78982/g.221409 Transcript_78982/m.221409 type:complete len:314 (-) Transcript_78982:17-958(-)
MACGLQLHLTEVADARVLQQLGQLRMSQRRLAELDAKARAEEALQVRQGDLLVGVAGLLHELLQVLPKGLPRRDDGDLRARRAQARPLALRVLLLQHGLRACVWHQGAIGVAEQLFVRDRKLHDVCDLPQGVALEEAQLPVGEDARTHVAASWEKRLLTLQRCEIHRGVDPQLRRVHILGTVDIDEAFGLPHEGRHPLGALRVRDAQPRDRLASHAELPVLHAPELGRAALRGALRDALPEDAAVGPQPVGVEALHRGQDVGGCRRVAAPAARRLAVCTLHLGSVLQRLTPKHGHRPDDIRREGLGRRRPPDA